MIKKPLIVLASLLMLVAASQDVCAHNQETPTPAKPQAAFEYADTVAKKVELSRHTFERKLMGTGCVITVYADNEKEARASADAAFKEMARLESVMSDYIQSYPDSELLQLAKFASANPDEAREVSDDLWPVLLRSVKVHGVTDGAFDITAKPFTNMWRTSRERRELPPKAAVERMRPFVGMQHLVLDEEKQTARLAKAGAWLDLGGIAKGYIADRALEVLQARGLTIAQVQAGGDMALGDPPPGLKGWPINIPDFPPRKLDNDQESETGLAFWHANGGVSVSGDAFRFVEIEGVRYSHVIDPRTGLGVTGSRYCCVKGPSAFATDAAATVGCILDQDAFETALDNLSEIEGPLTGWRFQGKSSKP
ncbi:MAG: FAD:protein FMN transferase [Planctomycetota bacterium]